MSDPSVRFTFPLTPPSPLPCYSYQSYQYLSAGLKLSHGLREEEKEGGVLHLAEPGRKLQIFSRSGKSPLDSAVLTSTVPPD